VLLKPGVAEMKLNPVEIEVLNDNLSKALFNFIPESAATESELPYITAKSLNNV
jgi:hypothetical protein